MPALGCCSCYVHRHVPCHIVKPCGVSRRHNPIPPFPLCPSPPLPPAILYDRFLPRSWPACCFSPTFKMCEVRYTHATCGRHCRAVPRTRTCFLYRLCLFDRQTPLVLTTTVLYLLTSLTSPVNKLQYINYCTLLLRCLIICSDLGPHVSGGDNELLEAALGLSTLRTVPPDRQAVYASVCLFLARSWYSRYRTLLEFF